MQTFRPRDGSWPILGAVGTLQFEVLASRLVAEYGVEARLEAAPYETARWITGEKPDVLKRFCDTNRSAIADDNAGSPVFLARSAWVLRREVDEWPDIAFVNVMERN